MKNYKNYYTYIYKYKIIPYFKLYYLYNKTNLKYKFKNLNIYLSIPKHNLNKTIYNSILKLMLDLCKSKLKILYKKNIIYFKFSLWNIKKILNFFKKYFNYICFSIIKQFYRTYILSSTIYYYSLPISVYSILKNNIHLNIKYKYSYTSIYTFFILLKFFGFIFNTNL